MILGTPTAGQTQVRAFDLPAQPSSQALPEFGRQAGIQIIAPADGLPSDALPPIRGTIDTREALRRLIAGTGLEIASDTGGTIVLRRRPSEPTPVPPSAEIVVTGTRIEAATALPTAPITRIFARELSDRQGGISLGDQLSLLPQFRPSFTQAATTAVGVQATGQVGLNLLDLRGLGAARTLVLMDGRRLVTSTQLVSQPDINTIPAALLARVDVLTGGASAVYGADAIAGAVNFVLKQDFTGVVIDGQAGISERGDAGTRQLSLTAGHDLGGRGNVAVALSYAVRDGLRFAGRGFAATRTDFVANPDARRPGEPTTIPVRDLRSLAISDGGTVTTGPAVLRFGPDGTLAPAATGTRAFPLIGLSAGGDGADLTGNGSLLPANERFGGTLLAHRDIGDASAVFGQLDAVRQTAEAFAAPTTVRLPFRRDNPFLSASARAVLDSLPPAGASGSFELARTLDDFGTLSERNTRTTVRGLVGFRSRPIDDLRFEVSYSYGRTGIVKDNRSNIDLSRLGLAADAVRDEAGTLGTPGAIVCRSRLAEPQTRDPAVASCVPADLFGFGAPDRAARAYVASTTRSTGAFQQHLLSGLVSGTTDSFLRLGGGGVRVLAGLEFRREITRYTPDPRDERGVTLVSGQRLSGAIDVYEAYGELIAPIATDVPGARRLDLGGALRASRYGLAGLGTRISWGLNGLWQPVAAISLRTSYQHAVRAPNITELYQPPLASRGQVIDPCDARAINDGAPSRIANCRALGIPADYQATAVPMMIDVATSGNPDLDVERGRSLTVGVSVEPPRSGVRVAVDYYDIDLRGAIAQPNGAALTPGSVAAGCVDARQVPNDYCALVERGPDLAIRRVRLFPVNLVRQVARGIDVDASVSADISAATRLESRLLLSHVVARDDFRIPSRPEFGTRIAGTALAPRWQASLATGVSRGRLTLFHRLRFMSSVYLRPDDPAFFESVGGRPPLDPDRRAAGLIRSGSTWYNDLRIGLGAPGRSEIYLGIDNLSDRKPPFSLIGAGSYGTQFDAVGRFIYSGVKWRL